MLRCCELLVGRLAARRRRAADGRPGASRRSWTTALLSYARCFSRAWDGGTAGAPARSPRTTWPPRSPAPRCSSGTGSSCGCATTTPTRSVNPRERFSVGVAQDADGAASGRGDHLDPAAPGRRRSRCARLGAIAYALSDRGRRADRGRPGGACSEDLRTCPRADLDQLATPRPRAGRRARGSERCTSTRPADRQRSRSSAARCRCFGPPSWPRSPTSTPATSPPTSPPARRYGYLLLWVLIVSNLMAMLIQYLSAKAGIATGKSLAELCREAYPRRVTRGLWVQAELVAIATDLAEVLGGAIALQLLFGLPLLVGGHHHRRSWPSPCSACSSAGAARSRWSITGLMLVVLVGLPLQPGRGRGRPGAVSSRGSSRGSRARPACCWPTGMLGATVMPHVIYLHGVAHPAPLRAGHRAAAARPAAQPAARRRRGDEPRRGREPHHARGRGPAAVGLGGSRHHARGRPRGPRRRARADRRHAVRAGAARLRLRRVGCRHARRPGRDAGLPAPPDPAGACAGWSPWPPRWS